MKNVREKIFFHIVLFFVLENNENCSFLLLLSEFCKIKGGPKITLHLEILSQRQNIRPKALAQQER
jgi:hypothetical protein